MHAYPGLLLRFGGHAMAAGLTLQRADIERFAQEFDAIARAHLDADQLDAVLHTDGELGPADFTLELAQRLRDAGPWGQAFPEPLFDGVFAVDSCRVVGEKHLAAEIARARIRRSCSTQCDSMPKPARCHRARIRAVFQLDVNDWNGAQSLRLLIRHIEPA